VGREDAESAIEEFLPRFFAAALCDGAAAVAMIWANYTALRGDSLNTDRSVRHRAAAIPA
jgi:hypothetical protein